MTWQPWFWRSPVSDFGSPTWRSINAWLADAAEMIGAVILIGVSVYVGYKTQYLDADDFSGERGIWGSLTAWAFGIQVTGSTVVQLLGRATGATGEPAAPKPG